MKKKKDVFIKSSERKEYEQKYLSRVIVLDPKKKDKFFKKKTRKKK